MTFSYTPLFWPFCSKLRKKRKIGLVSIWIVIMKAKTIGYNVVVLVFNKAWIYQGVQFNERRAQNHYDILTKMYVR